MSLLENRPFWRGRRQATGIQQTEKRTKLAKTTVSRTHLCVRKGSWQLMFKTAARCLVWNSRLCSSCFAPDEEAGADWIKAEVCIATGKNYKGALWRPVPEMREPKLHPSQQHCEPWMIRTFPGCSSELGQYRVTGETTGEYSSWALGVNPKSPCKWHKTWVYLKVKWLSILISKV